MKTTTLLALAAIMAAPFAASAEDTYTYGNDTTARKDHYIDKRDTRQDLRQDVRQDRRDVRQDVRADRRGNVQDRVNARRDAVNERVDARRNMRGSSATPPAPAVKP